MSNELNSKSEKAQPMVYQIRIKGHLGREWADWFEGLTITALDNGETLLTGPVVDQAALHGLLRKVRDVGLPLLSVVCVKPDQAEVSDVKATHHLRSRKEEKMKTMNKTTVMKDRKAMLSILWIFVMFNLTYADILTLYFNNVLQKEIWKAFQSGYVGSLHITQGFVLVGAVLMETAIAMVLLSRVLKYRANRWANIIVGVIQIAEVAWSLTGPLYWNLFYAFFATIEIACMLFIVWYAWTWRQPEEGGALASGQSSLYEQEERDERAFHAHADK